MRSMPPAYWQNLVRTMSSLPLVAGTSRAQNYCHDRLDLLLTLAALFTLAVRHGRPAEPRVPSGYDGERQIAELRALVSSTTNVRLP